MKSQVAVGHFTEAEICQPADTPPPSLPGWCHHTHTHTQHINTQLSTNNFISTLYFNIDFKLLFKT